MRSKVKVEAHAEAEKRVVKALAGSESREQALMRMKDRANELGADAIVGVRFQTSMILSGTAELLVYGTAVKFKK